MITKESVWEKYVIPNLLNQPATIVETSRVEYRDVILSEDQESIQYLRKNRTDGWSNMSVTKKSLHTIWEWLETPIDKRSQHPPGCESNVSKKHIAMWALGFQKEDGLVTKNTNNHYIIRKKSPLWFSHNTPYLRVDPNLFYAMLAELGWEQTNEAGSKEFRVKTRLVLQGRTWAPKWRGNSQRYEYVYLSVEINKELSKIDILLGLSKKNTQTLPSPLNTVQFNEWKTVSSKIFPEHLTDIQPDALISWNQREELKDCIRKNLEAIQDGWMETNIGVRWPKQELPLVSEVPTVWWAINLVDYDQNGNQIPYHQQALDHDIVGIGWLTYERFKNTSLTDASSLQSQLQSVLHKSKPTNKCLGFLYIRPGDNIILLNGGSPVWIGTVTNTILKQDSYEGLGLSHIFRSVKWRQQIGTYTFAQIKYDIQNPALYNTVRQTIAQEISSQNPNISCNLDNIGFSGKTLDTPKQHYNKHLFTQSYNTDTLHAQYIEQRAKTVDPTTYAIMMHISDVTTTNKGPSPMPIPQPSSTTQMRIEDLQQFQNIIFEGVPGTGKTFAVSTIVRHWADVDSGRQILLGNGQGQYATTFHPSTSYEDFVEGLKPRTNQPDNGKDDEQQPQWFTEPAFVRANSSWVVQDGFFLKACQEAFHHPKNDFIILIDEINRANVPKVLGDLLTTIERSKRASFITIEDHLALKNTEAHRSFVPTTDGYWETTDCQIVSLPYSQRQFFVPDNLYIIATMNTTDRSVAPLDAALRRRFAFVRIEPMSDDNNTDSSISTVIQKTWGADTLKRLSNSIDTWCKLNTFLKNKIGPDAMLGHSYILVLAKEISKMKAKENANKIIQRVWEKEIIPQVIDTLMSNNEQREYLNTISDEQQDTSINSILNHIGYHLTLHGRGLSEMLTIDSPPPSKNNDSTDSSHIDQSQSNDTTE